MQSRIGRAYAGGTYQCRNGSPNGGWEVEGSDVGGVRRRRRGQVAWESLPTAGDDADRKVSGAVVLDDGTVFSLVGNASTTGRLLEHRPGGEVVVLADGLYVLANAPSRGDADKRPRPVGWTLLFDRRADVLLACTEDGLHRHERDASDAPNAREARDASGIVALAGESLRGFVHDAATTVVETGRLALCTRARGVVLIEDVHRRPSVLELGSPTRAEDGAWTPGGRILAACHRQGVHRIDPRSGRSVDITPAAVTAAAGHDSLGANGGRVSWTAVDVHPETGIGLATMINPTEAHEWVWRSTVPVDEATANDWEGITHERMALLEGVGYVRPLSRVLGGRAHNGRGLTGGQHVSFVRGDASGNTVHFLGTLTNARTVNALAPDPAAVRWASDVQDSSLLSMTDVAVSETGAMAIAVTDHNSVVADSLARAADRELARVGVSGLTSAYAVAVVGDVWVLAPCNPHRWIDAAHGWYYARGAGAPSEWIPVGWAEHAWNRADDFPAALDPLPNVPPRPVSLCGHATANGGLRFHGMADGVGMVYQDYAPASDRWSPPRISRGGPTDEAVVSLGVNVTRSSACSADGGVVLHQLQRNGHLYRSLDGGWTVQRIAAGDDGPPIEAKARLRTGFMQLNERRDLAVVSNSLGLYVVTDVTAPLPRVRRLTRETMGPVAIDPDSGTTYVHINQGGAARLLAFDDIRSARSLEDGRDIASDRYARHLGNQAAQLRAFNVDGERFLVTLYQGGGCLISAV